MKIPDLSKHPHLEKFNKKKDYFILDENRNAIPATLMEWAEYFENTKKRIVKQENIGDYWISTVFFGLDYGLIEMFYLKEGSMENYKPQIFETMVFTNKQDLYEIYCDRCSTWKEAEECHEKAIEWVNNGCKNEE